MPYLDRGKGEKIFYDAVGPIDGTPIITLHGFIENGGYWSRTGVSQGLADAGYRVYDMDMRGHGRSVPSPDAPDYTLPTLISDIEALANHLELDRFHLMGHATGGIVCCRYAIERSDRLLSLIGTDTASMTLVSDQFCDPEWDDKPIPPCESNPGEYSAMALEAFGTLENYVTAARAGDPSNMFAQFYTTYGKNADPERCWRWTRDIHCTNVIQNCIDFARINGNNDQDPHALGLRTIKCPVLLFIGSEDHIMMKPMELMARNIPNCKFVKMQGICHMTAIEAPEETLELIRDFLSGLE